MSKTPINLFTGFLGAGKTTALLHLLAHKPADEVWAVIVNEFGEIGIDGAVLSGALFEVTVDPEQGKMSGRGFMLNDANGRAHARYIYTGAMRGNSIDTAEVQAPGGTRRFEIVAVRYV